MESLKIKLITYNVGDKSADQNKPEELFNFVKSENFDFIFIGLQEVVSDSTWTSLIKNSFAPYNYVLVKIRNIWAMWLYALVKRSHLLQIDNVESEVTASGYGGVLGNKGGVSIRFKYQGISIVIVNGHFTAHEEGFKDRLNDYLDIITNQSFRDHDVKTILDHDIVFWMGDLNFRIEKLNKDEIEQFIYNKNYSALIKHDQLNGAIENHMLFKDFKEGELHFPPTFKFDDDCDKYDTSKKQRKPAWTDRILYMTHGDDKVFNPAVKLLGYYSEPNVRGSDHRPVCAEMEVSFNSTVHQHLPIEFKTITNAWQNEKDQVVEYRLIKTDTGDDDSHNHMSIFKPDSWDWIALVPSNWSILSEDTITYVYVTCTCSHELQNMTSVEFGKRYLSTIHPKTELQLIYYSKRKNCIQGISNVFSFT